MGCNYFLKLYWISRLRLWSFYFSDSWRKYLRSKIYHRRRKKKLTSRKTCSFCTAASYLWWWPLMRCIKWPHLTFTWKYSICIAIRVWILKGYTELIKLVKEDTISWTVSFTHFYCMLAICFKERNLRSLVMFKVEWVQPQLKGFTVTTPTISHSTRVSWQMIIKQM